MKSSTGQLQTVENERQKMRYGRSRDASGHDFAEKCARRDETEAFQRCLCQEIDSRPSSVPWRPLGLIIQDEDPGGSRSSENLRHVVGERKLVCWSEAKRKDEKEEQ